MNIRLRHLTTTLGLLVLLTATAEARPRILEPINDGRGIASPVRPSSETEREKAAVRMQGRLEYSHREGLTLNGRTVSVTPRTSTYPALGKSDRLIDPSKLDGKDVTLFGHAFGDVIDASLLIFSNSPEIFRMPTVKMPAGHAQPSSVAPELDELTTKAPR